MKSTEDRLNEITFSLNGNRIRLDHKDKMQTGWEFEFGDENLKDVPLTALQRMIDLVVKESNELNV